MSENTVDSSINDIRQAVNAARTTSNAVRSASNAAKKTARGIKAASSAVKNAGVKGAMKMAAKGAVKGATVAVKKLAIKLAIALGPVLIILLLLSTVLSFFEIRDPNEYLTEGITYDEVSDVYYDANGKMLPVAYIDEQGNWYSETGAIIGTTEEYFYGKKTTVDDGEDYHLEDYDYLEDGEDKYKEALQLQIDAVRKRIKKRADEVLQAVYSMEGEYKELIKESSRYKDKGYKDLEEDMMVVAEEIDDAAALKLIALYTIQYGGDAFTTETGDLLRYVGNSSLFGGKSTMVNLGHGIKTPISNWSGTFMPQYAIEQALYEKDHLGFVVAKEKGCAAADLLLCVHAPSLSEIFIVDVARTEPTEETETVPVLDEEGNPVLNEFGEPMYEERLKTEMVPVLDEDGEPVLDEKGDPVYEERTIMVENVYAKALINIYIGVRDVDELARLANLTLEPKPAVQEGTEGE